MSLPAFVNEPLLELRRREQRDTLLAGLQTVEQRLPLRVPMLIGGQTIEGEELRSTDPGEPERLVALAPQASSAQVVSALEEAAGSDWAQAPLDERVQALLAAAEWMRTRRHQLAALCVRECAKPWADADADVAEAIDFLEYYARGALALDAHAAVAELPGERNWMRHQARGVCAVIAPWNFPLAIPCGMLAAALVTGNAAVLKPAEQSPACGAAVVAALRAGGVPPGALGLLHGDGDVGAALVADPRVDVIAFTGSAAVGLEIVRRAGQPAAGQRHFKRVVAETGGKNCIVIDSDADLDEAVPAIVQSAFGYAGQKCSAASRVLVHEAIAPTLLERLGGAVASLQVGQAADFASDLGPLIEREAQARVERYGLIAQQQGRIVERHSAGVPDTGWFCAPLLVGDLPPDSPVLSEEIFGPLLAVETVSGVTEALERIEQLPYALTGGLFARNPHTIERFVARSPVGNLYINRHITGAMVGRQPFGGNRLSGTGAKAGGPDYLLQFVESQAVSENVVRRGLVGLSEP